jgi:hypothetical protein
VKRSSVSVNIIGIITGLITSVIVIFSFVYLLALRPFLKRGRFDRGFSRRVERRHAPAPWSQMEKMLRRYYPELFEDEFWEAMQQQWVERCTEFDKDIWDWLERRFEEYFQEKPETEHI